MKILNLYAGIGGNRKLWGDEHNITAVEKNKEVAAIYADMYPQDTVIVGDAHKYLLQNFENFNFIWSSPPCQSHSRMNLTLFYKNNIKRYPNLELWQEIIFLKKFYKGFWVVENVIPYYQEFVSNFYLLGRNRFYSNFYIPPKEFERPKNLEKLKIEDLKKYLGYENLSKNIYLDTHDPRQVLRNAVHPEIGLYVLNSALGINSQEQYLLEDYL